MTIKHAELMLEDVRNYAHDPEKAHMYEDDLRRAVLLHIAQGGKDARKLAWIALNSEQIRFPRWAA